MVLCKANRQKIQDVLRKGRLGVYTATAESFGLAVFEQLEHFPVALKAAPYTLAFPLCPTFDTVDEAVSILERLYYHNEEYAQVKDDCKKHLFQAYSYEKMRDYAIAAAQFSSSHTVSAATEQQILGKLSKEAMPITDLYERLGWNSPLLGMQALTILRRQGKCEFLQRDSNTLVGLPGCHMPRVTSLF